jgi:hypothetical protein
MGYRGADAPFLLPHGPTKRVLENRPAYSCLIRPGVETPLFTPRWLTGRGVKRRIYSPIGQAFHETERAHGYARFRGRRRGVIYPHHPDGCIFPATSSKPSGRPRTKRPGLPKDTPTRKSGTPTGRYPCASTPSAALSRICAFEGESILGGASTRRSVALPRVRQSSHRRSGLRKLTCLVPTMTQRRRQARRCLRPYARRAGRLCPPDQCGCRGRVPQRAD